jgi:hypothetical protein
MESKEYSWAWVTADRLLSHGPCELIYAYEVVTATSLDTHIYNGQNTSGEKVATLGITVVAGTDTIVAIPPAEFRPPVPVYCRLGLYIDKGTDVTGIFVMWRELK